MSQITHYLDTKNARPVTARGRFNSDPSNLLGVQQFKADFPNLPGFSKYERYRPQSPKAQTLNFKNGFMMVNTLPSPEKSLSLSVDMTTLLNRPMTSPSSWSPSSLSKEVYEPNDVSGRYSLSRQRSDRSKNRVSLPFCPSSKLPAFLEHDRRVLLFHAYYDEDVHQNPVETRRIHKCEIYFYVEDGTIEIIQTKQENSGIPQGVFLRRGKVQKPAVNGFDHFDERDENDGLHQKEEEKIEYYGIDDLKLGNEVEIYSRIFHIVDCNESTRDYVTKVHGWEQIDVSALPFPRDHFAESNKAKMRRESGVPGVDRKRKMHELKEVMESMLGKQSSTTDRGMFLECGQSTLCFHAVWDDRERLYGDIQFFRLFYYLADDTIEILPIHKKNDGRDAVPKLLKRSKLPKDGMLRTGDEKVEYYNWKDLKVGSTVNVFGRMMLLSSCDLFTREHYKGKGIEFKDDILMQPEEKVEFVRHIPPYNGFGSEEDSLRSCTGGLNPPPPKRDLAKMRDKQGIVLSFNARMLSDKTNRRFVIQYFMEDDTIAIREPPIRNSGVMGGNFLRRQVIKKPDGKKYTATDMFTGNLVDFMCHQFELLNADEYTYRLMENDERTFPYSNYNHLRKLLGSRIEDINKYFASEYKGDGKLDITAVGNCCEYVGLKFNKQQILTIWRKLDKKGKGKISFAKFLKIIANVGP